MDTGVTQIVIDAQKGDQKAMGRLFEMYRDQLYFYVKSHINNPHDIEDILQDTFLGVVKNIKSLDNPEKFNGWLYRIAYLKITDYYRKNNSSNVPLMLDDEWEQVDVTAEFIPGELMESEETRRYVAGLVGELPYEQKTTVLLYYYQQLSIAEIAEIMDCAEGTVKSSLNYARKTIKSKIEGEQKKGYKVIAVVPIPILTQILRWQAEQITIPMQVASSISSSIASAGTPSSTGAGITTAKTALSGKAIMELLLP